MKIIKQMRLREGVLVSLVTKEDAWLPPNIKEQMGNRQYSHALILEIDTGEASSVYPYFKKHDKVVTGNLVFGDEQGARKLKAYLVPQQETMMAMTSSGLCPNIEEEEVVRREIRRVENQNAHGKTRLG